MAFSACLPVAKDKVPDEVKTAFQQKYPGEDDPNWQIDKNGNFEAQFKKDGKRYRADFSPQGPWIETELTLKKKDLPKAVQVKIKSEYDTFKIVEIEEVDHSSKGRFYDVEFSLLGKKKDVEFNESGQVLN